MRRSATPDRRTPPAAGIALVAFLATAAAPALALAQSVPIPDYAQPAFIDSRLAVWIAAQLHLDFAAFVLAVPMFALAIEFFGWRMARRDPAGAARYDWLAHEMARLLPAAYSLTAISGALLGMLLFSAYPRLMAYMTETFGPTFAIYPLFFVAETLCLYFWYYAWDRLQGRRKWAHILLGLLLNIFGTIVMFIANAWATFMMTPGGVDEAGALVSLYGAIWNPGWMPLNVHRLIANITFGALLCAAYAAYRFLSARTEAERALYDWMGYTGNLIALFTMLFLPFAGYYFGFELFAYSATYGVTLMGGVLSWLFIIQAIVIAILFIGAAYYAWLGLLRIPGSEPQRRLVPAFNVALIAGFMVWATPHSMAASIEESTGQFHPLLGALGLMAPKMIAVTLILVVLYVSYLLYRRAGKVPVVAWAATGTRIEWALIALMAATILGLGIYGYFAPADVRIKTSIWQILVLIGGIVVTFVIDLYLLRGARTQAAVRWGTMPRRGQYILILLAFVIVWLMGLMGYARSGARLNWHVFGLVEDTSPGAGLPPLGDAAIVVTAITLIFFALLGVAFAISALGGRAGLPAFGDRAGEAAA
ncbi:MAG: cytochrome ubiquinol oxidase subunit I [Rhodobacteraceae bacterium]|nr:cytochrome ubiquinol oxidase subunit I [Paracoccaceae bacterium]MCP5340937.1 cytochrome ubiquinol oxidase subunit I [Paracoccaceae bacterium]